MNAPKTLAPLAGLLLLLAVAPVQAQRGGDPSIPDEVRALMMRHGAKGLAEDYEGKRNDPAKATRQGQSSAGGSGGCNVAIGNVDNTQRGGVAPRQVTTIITGPVIQSNNKCN